MAFPWKLVTAATCLVPRWREMELTTATSGTAVVDQGAGLGGTEGAGLVVVGVVGVASRRQVSVSRGVVGGEK